MLDHLWKSQMPLALMLLILLCHVRLLVWLVTEEQWVQRNLSLPLGKFFASRLQDILGYHANPWSPRDAFMASGMYLTDLGAVGNSTSTQNRAACKYYGSGGLRVLIVGVCKN